MFSFILSTNIYGMPDTMLGKKDVMMKKADMGPALRKDTVWQKRQA